MTHLERLYELAPALSSLREEAKQGRDPTCADETLEYILALCEEKQPSKILEIGCGEGLSSASMLLFCEASLTAIEADPSRRSRAEENFLRFNLSERVKLHEGDAGEILPMLKGPFDLIFLDGPKAQYRNYFPHLMRLLPKGGVLLSDDVLLFGWVHGEPPAKRRMLTRHIEEYLELLKSDESLETQILPLGEGLAVSVKR